MAGRDVSWNQALDLVAARFGEALAEHGRDSVAFYASGQLLTEDYYVANKLMKGYIGSANIDTNSRLCMASAVAAHERSFGSDTMPGVHEDLELADLVVLVGSNLAWCHPVLYQRLEEAKAARPGLTIVNIDPRRTVTTALADLHLPLRPGSDLGLFNGLLAEIERQHAIDRSYVDTWTSGLDQALAAAKAMSAAEVAEVTGLNPEQLQRFYDLWISTERVVTLFSQGINQSTNGTDKASAIINCHLATGRIGRVGMGPFSITGQPNAMGGREVGGLATALAAHLDLKAADHRLAVRAFWGSPRIADKPGLKAVDLFHACKTGGIKALWILSTNPVDSMPEANLVRAALRRCPFVVVSDIVADTDTTREADLLLPAAAWGEKSGSVTNTDRTISRQRAFRDPPGEARPDWQILCEVARRMGWQEAFDFDSPAAVFREHAALSGIAGQFGRGFDISDLAEIDEESYAAMEPFRWPSAKETARDRFFADGGFHTEEGRARLIATPYRSCVQQPSPTWPLRLLTGRIRDHWHTMTRTAQAPRLSRRHPEPCVEIHPADALRFGICQDDLVTLENPLGQAILRAHLTDATPEGSLFAPIHWSESYAAAARIDTIVAADCDPVSGQPAFKASLARVKRFRPDWWGLAAARAKFRPICEYWALIRATEGWAAHLAGTGWKEVQEPCLGLATQGERVTIHENADELFVAELMNGKVEALFLAARSPISIMPDQLAFQIGREADLDRLRAWRQAAEQRPADEILCACFSVGRKAISEAIATQKLNSVGAVGQRLRAGTNCGTCRPEIANLLSAIRSQP